MSEFKLHSTYKPTGDQPKAINQIYDGFATGLNKLTLMGATGTGKTFTMANIIQKLNKPTLVLSHNKTLAAQLATEFKYFFPRNAVHYFVSYFDYYQPEAYIPERDMYIEKDSSINTDIEMYRLGTMASLLSRQDVIVVSSVSALYGLGSKEIFEKNVIFFYKGESYNITDVKKKLIGMQYKPMQSKIEPGTFDIRGEILDVYSSVDKIIYRFIFDEDVLEKIQMKDAVTYEDLGFIQKAAIWPATQFLQDMAGIEPILQAISQEMESWVKELKSRGKELEANRIYKRTMYDIRMIKETGFVNGIENYSRYFDRRQPGQPPNTIFDYFPDDFLLIIDESHMSVPQIRAMPQADHSRKTSLVQHGFRLPSALDHRPVNFQELEYILHWKDPKKVQTKNDLDSDIDNIINDQIKTQEVDLSLFDKHIKTKPHTLFVSATPGEYELKISDEIIEQIIRPTGLLDPITYVYPKSGDYGLLTSSIDKLFDKKNHLKKYFQGYEQDIDLKDLFFGG